MARRVLRLPMQRDDLFKNLPDRRVWNFLGPGEHLAFQSKGPEVQLA
jgi:hypothetical protein